MHDKERRTARENIEDLVDGDSFLQYGSSSSARASPAASTSSWDMRHRTAWSGPGQVNRDLFGPERSRCAVMSYDYTVLAGTRAAPTTA
jgi:acetyl-CoA carboxylase carboxyltransferase component